MLGDEMSEINFDLEATRRCLTLVTMQKKKKKEKKKKRKFARSWGELKFRKKPWKK